MLVTPRHDWFQRATVLRDHGRAQGDVAFWNQEVAFKYKMSSLQAALGLAQLERVEELVGHKRRVFAWYQEELRDLAGVAWNVEPPGTRNAFWMTTAVLDPERGPDKSALAERLSARGIDTRPFFHPLSTLPAYAGRPEAVRARERNVHATRVTGYGINLPCSATLTRPQVAYVADSFRAAIRG